MLKSTLHTEAVTAPVEQVTFEEKRQRGEQLAAQKQEDEDFLSNSKACDLSGEGTCEACQ